MPLDLHELGFQWWCDCWGANERRPDLKPIKADEIAIQYENWVSTESTHDGRWEQYTQRKKPTVTDPKPTMESGSWATLLDLSAGKRSKKMGMNLWATEVGLKKPREKWSRDVVTRGEVCSGWPKLDKCSTTGGCMEEVSHDAKGSEAVGTDWRWGLDRNRSKLKC